MRSSDFLFKQTNDNSWGGVNSNVGSLGTMKKQLKYMFVNLTVVLF